MSTHRASRARTLTSLLSAALLLPPSIGHSLQPAKVVPYVERTLPQPTASAPLPFCEACHSFNPNKFYLTTALVGACAGCGGVLTGVLCSHNRSDCEKAWRDHQAASPLYEVTFTFSTCSDGFQPPSERVENSAIRSLLDPFGSASPPCQLVWNVTITPFSGEPRSLDAPLTSGLTESRSITFPKGSSKGPYFIQIHFLLSKNAFKTGLPYGELTYTTDPSGPSGQLPLLLESASSHPYALLTLPIGT